jgi:uncharacterized protein YggE
MIDNMNFSEKRSDQIGFVVIITLVALTLFLLANLFNVSDDNTEATITVSGEGQAFAVPDTATFSYTLRGEGDNAQSAQAAIATQSAEIIDALENSGVAETDIKTQYYNVSPRYEFREVSADRGMEIFPPQGSRVLVGYEAVQTNQVRVREVDTAGDLLGVVTENGASDVSSLDFIVWDETAVESEARTKAIADAKEKANQLANQLGVRLGDIQSFSESSGDFPGPFEARMETMSFDEEVASASPAVSLGENEINKTVNITFEIN